MTWGIEYTETSLRELKKLDKSIALRVVDFMDERVAQHADPRAIGKNLVGPKMGSYWRFRVGEVRVICDVHDRALLVLLIWSAP